MVLDIIILGLSGFKSILEIKGLKQIDIFLSITSYLLLSNFDQQIEESINKGKIGFLTSTSRISICKDSKKQNFREKIGLKYQITESLNE